MSVELTKVTKRYGRVTALDGVSLSVPAGARVALIGPNGSGKTTLLRAVLGLVRHEGAVRAAGRVAYVPQLAPRLSATVAEVVRAVAGARGDDLDAVHALARRLDLELGDPRLGRRPFAALSGGMKHKVLLALALAARADVLILDEPTASLDASARQRFFELFAEVPAQVTLLLSSHRLEELRSLVDRVVSLADGRVAYDGPTEGFLARRAAASIELAAHGLVASAWLVAHGFARGAAGWWTRTVAAGDKLAVVRAAVDALGGDLANLAVRDLETLGDGEVGHA